MNVKKKKINWKKKKIVHKLNLYQKKQLFIMFIDLYVSR